tara:strand:- start:1018 stop:1293 length:276 start_codon:yes stop_codon:yes gene_type:complete
MTKRMITTSEECSLTWECLDSVKETIGRMIEKYGKDAYLTVEEDYGSHDIWINYKREETDKEYQRRLEWERKSEENERARYLTLKKKFEGE